MKFKNRTAKDFKEMNTSEQIEYTLVKFFFHQVCKRTLFHRILFHHYFADQIITSLS
eukprot:UN26502